MIAFLATIGGFALGTSVIAMFLALSGVSYEQFKGALGLANEKFTKMEDQLADLETRLNEACDKGKEVVKDAKEESKSVINAISVTLADRIDREVARLRTEINTQCGFRQTTENEIYRRIDDLTATVDAYIENSNKNIDIDNEWQEEFEQRLDRLETFHPASRSAPDAIFVGLTTQPNTGNPETFQDSGKTPEQIADDWIVRNGQTPLYDPRYSKTMPWNWFDLDDAGRLNDLIKVISDRLESNSGCYFTETSAFDDLRQALVSMLRDNIPLPEINPETFQDLGKTPEELAGKWITRNKREPRREHDGLKWYVSLIPEQDSSYLPGEFANRLKSGMWCYDSRELAFADLHKALISMIRNNIHLPEIHQG